MEGAGWGAKDASADRHAPENDVNYLLDSATDYSVETSPPCHASPALKGCHMATCPCVETGRPASRRVTAAASSLPASPVCPCVRSVKKELSCEGTGALSMPHLPYHGTGTERAMHSTLYEERVHATVHVTVNASMWL